MNKPNPFETKELIQKELEQKEIEAAELMQWLQDHPNGSLDDKSEVRRRLNETLQAINDLVCKLNPGKIYMVH